MPATVVNDAGSGRSSGSASSSGSSGYGANSGAVGGGNQYASSPYDSAIPGVADYAGADAAAIKAYSDALANINQSRQSLLRANGYTGTVDPNTGNITNLQIDPYNPYGQLQQMFGNQANEDINADEANVARGLHGGLANQAEHALAYTHGLERTNFGQTMQGVLQGLTSQQTDAASTRDNALWQAQRDAAMNAILNEQFNPALYGTQTQDSGGDTAPFLSLGTEAADHRQQALHRVVTRAVQTRQAKSKKKGGR